MPFPYPHPSFSTLNQVGAAPLREDREAFEMIPVDADEVRDLDFANDSSKFLKTLAERLANGTCRTQCAIWTVPFGSDKRALGCAPAQQAR